MLTWLRELAATVGTFDRSALEPGYALRCTVGVAIPLVIAAMLGKPSLGVAAAIGAFITGFTSLQGIYRTRLLGRSARAPAIPMRRRATTITRLTSEGSTRPAARSTCSSIRSISAGAQVS